MNVQANVYPYTRGNNDLVSIIPPWAHEGGKAALIARLKDPALRDRLKREIRDGPARLVQPLHGRRRRLGPDARSAPGSQPANDAFEGQTMDRVIAAESAGIRARHPTRSTSSSTS